MGAQEPSDTMLLAEPTIFVPSFNPRYPPTSMARQRNVSSGNCLDSVDFERKGLLLIQDEKGSCWWTGFANLFEQDHKTTPLPCGLSLSEVDYIVRERVLFIADGDLRLSDFGLLSQYHKPPMIDEALEELDLAAHHLASTRRVHIFTVDADGKRTWDETKTADYHRAKADIRRNPADTRNMRRFCNHQWNGEGPSARNSRICPGYVPPSARWPPPLPGSPQDTPFSRLSRRLSQDSDSTTTASAWDEPYGRPRAPTAPERSRDVKRSLVYCLLRLALVPRPKIEARLRRHDLRRARREKKPQEQPCTPRSRSRWSAVLSPLRDLVGGARGVTSLPGEQPTAAGAVGEVDGLDQEDEALPPSPPSGLAAVETLIGVPAEGHALLLRPKKDSLGEGITGGDGACESKAAFVDPGVSTMAGSEDIQRNWNGNGGWKWIFDEGMG